MVPGSRQVGADYVAVTILAPVSPLVVAEAAAPASPVATSSTHSGFDHRCRCSSEGFVSACTLLCRRRNPIRKFQEAVIVIEVHIDNIRARCILDLKCCIFRETLGPGLEGDTESAVGDEAGGKGEFRCRTVEAGLIALFIEEEGD